MMTTKLCPHCGETETCLGYETTNDFCDDILEVTTEYVCTKYQCYFSETMRYTVCYQDTEITIIDDGEDE